MVDALANLVATLAVGVEENITILVCGQRVVTSPKNGDEEVVKKVCAYEIDEEAWRLPLIDYLEYRNLLSESRHKTKVQRRALCFLYCKGILHRCSFLGLWLQCLNNEEGKQVMQEAHASVCGVYQSRLKLHDRVKRMGYYWPTMCIILSTLLTDVMYVSYMLISFTNLRSHLTQL